SASTPRATATSPASGGGLGEGQLGTGGSQVVAQEAGVVAVARGVDADAEARGGAARRLRAGCRQERHKTSGTGGCAGPSRAASATADGEEACDKRSLPQDVTSSGVRHGGANLQQEVNASPDRKASPRLLLLRLPKPASWRYNDHTR